MQDSYKSIIKNDITTYGNARLAVGTSVREVEEWKSGRRRRKREEKGRRENG